MLKICETIEEQIALGTKLDAREHAHVEFCRDCQKLANDYESLSFLAESSLNSDVPAGFADSVMARVANDTSVGWSHWFERLATHPKLQYALLGVGGVISVINLVRVAIFVVIPAGGNF